MTGQYTKKRSRSTRRRQASEMLKWTLEPGCRDPNGIATIIMLKRCLILAFCLSLLGGHALCEDYDYTLGGRKVSQQAFDLAIAAEKLTEAGDLVGASEKYRQAIQLEPKIAGLHFNRGVLLFRLSKFK